MTISIPLFSRLARRSGTSHSNALLTPPLSYTSSEDIPFKPNDSDNVSLSMKKRHNGKRHQNCRCLNRSCLSNSDLQPREPLRGQQSPRPARCKSLPCLKRYQLHPTAPKRTTKKITTASRSGRPRRWTVPSKAASTRCLANTVAIDHQKGIQAAVQRTNTLSPAMITLRRATTTRKPRTMSLTFFPPPKFRRTKSGVLSAILGTIMGDHDRRTCNNAYAQMHQHSRRKSKLDSLDGGKAHPITSISASTICTEIVNVESSLSQPGRSCVATSVRRCSTRYTSGNSVYEIIWDENNSARTSRSVSSEPDVVIPHHRRSLAIDKLETQLCMAVAQSRRESLAAEAETNKRPLCGAEHGAVQRESFQDLFRFKFGKLAQEPALQDLPQSEASKTLKGKIRTTDGSDAESAVWPVHDKIAPTGQVEFFPPLRSCKPTTALGLTLAKVDIDAVEPSTAERPEETNTATRQKTAFGTQAGISAHMRRTTAPAPWLNRQRSAAVNETARWRPSPWAQPRMRSAMEEDTLPLMGESS